ncbi:hypothetical protein PoB_005230800 [Plakobranchus ocellatus]|uniref:Uncharacterized protein n=1 Tax=Plakobranchus ocellatus TaxID=259542 RepID=A0AAV4C314_9GAST|nr:hypothetical protein PoB_005230800 [Plakobranchus ocellatus]
MHSNYYNPARPPVTASEVRLPAPSGGHRTKGDRRSATYHSTYPVPLTEFKALHDGTQACTTSHLSAPDRGHRQCSSNLIHLLNSIQSDGSVSFTLLFFTTNELSNK